MIFIAVKEVEEEEEEEEVEEEELNMLTTRMMKLSLDDNSDMCHDVQKYGYDDALPPFDDNLWRLIASISKKKMQRKL